MSRSLPFATSDSDPLPPLPPLPMSFNSPVYPTFSSPTMDRRLSFPDFSSSWVPSFSDDADIPDASLSAFPCPEEVESMWPMQSPPRFALFSSSPFAPLASSSSPKQSHSSPFPSHVPIPHAQQPRGMDDSTVSSNPFSYSQSSASMSSSDSSSSPPVSPSAFSTTPQSVIERPRAPGGAKKKRRSHSAIDAVRRKKEALILSRLEQLTEAEDQPADDGESSKARLQRKREKLTVLQSSVQKIERLQEMVERLSLSAAAKDERVEAVLRHLRTMGKEDAETGGESGQLVTSASAPLDTAAVSTTMAGLMSYLEGQQTLYSAYFIQGRISIMVLEVDTGKIVDANRSASTSSSSTPASASFAWPLTRPLPSPCLPAQSVVSSDRLEALRRAELHHGQ